MAIPSGAEIAEMGFTPEMFGKKDDSELLRMLKGLVTEHGGLFSGRIGSGSYAAISEPINSYVKRSIKCLVAAELCQRRINRLAQEAKLEDGKDANKMRRSKSEYLTEVELLVGKIETAAGGDDGFAIGSVVTSHFAEDA